MMRRKLLWGLVAITAILVPTFLAGYLIRSTVRVEIGGASEEPNRPSLAEVDHAAYDALLHKYVNDHSLVAYAHWKANTEDSQALERYLKRMGCVDLRKRAPQAAQLAYWINLYNATTLWGILREYPTSSIRNHTAGMLGYNIWKDLFVRVDGQLYALDDMEHMVLRTMGEPRIHFAIVCASKGCPPLRNRAYTAAGLDQELADNARHFFGKPANLQTDESSRTVYLSELLKWYGSDFAPTPAEQLRVLRPYFPVPERLAWIEQPGVSVQYLPYDWNLNDQQPVAP
jgi:hypothetical protein